jgi:hypothetical protein
MPAIKASAVRRVAVFLIHFLRRPENVAGTARAIDTSCRAGPGKSVDTCNEPLNGFVGRHNLEMAL